MDAVPCPEVLSLFTLFLSPSVVSTILFSSHFSHIPTVEPITKGLAFYLWCHSCSKKVPVETESSLSRGGTIIFIALVGQNYILGNKPIWVNPVTQSVVSKSTKNKYVLETTAQCVKDKMHWERCKEITFSLIFHLTVTDVKKKALYAQNMLNYIRKRAKRTLDTIVKTTPSVVFLYTLFYVHLFTNLK